METTAMELKETADIRKPTKLFNKNFLLLWQGQFVSRMGNQVYMFAMVLWLTWTFDSQALNGLLGMLSGIPLVLLSAIGGTVADRVSRRKIIIYSDFLNGFAVLILAGMFFFIPDSWPDKNEVLLIGLFAVSIFGSTLMAFFGPAISAAIPDIVPEKNMAQANSLGQLSRQVAQFFGMGVGAWLLKVLGAPVLVLIDGITFIFSGISEIFIRIPQHIPEKKEKISEKYKQFKNELAEGLNFITKNKGLSRLVLFSIFSSFFATAITVLIPFYIKDTLQASKDWYAILLISYGIGTMFGYGYVSASHMNGKTRGKLMIFFMIMQGVGYCLLALFPDKLVALAVIFVGGMFNGFIVINITTLLQLTTPSNIRGRVFGVLTTISGSIAPLGMGLSGFVAEMLGGNIPLVYMGSGVMTIFAASLLSSSRPFRKFISYQTEYELKQSGFTYTIRDLKPEEIYLINKLKYKEFL
ncbi:MAG TPA: MFS transporter [Caldithrix abyssi]|uniref:MFS transporter n=1 Tax=Caldithrix abyssi TaxID=187145 RepID=A0A7V4U228_CALAY|nr:MFS transporter [Caldithrix abyssi]